jgi:hypothetical protein
MSPGGNLCATKSEMTFYWPPCARNGRIKITAGLRRVIRTPKFRSRHKMTDARVHRESGVGAAGRGIKIANAKVFIGGTTLAESFNNNKPGGV